MYPMKKYAFNPFTEGLLSWPVVMAIVYLGASLPAPAQFAVYEQSFDGFADEVTDLQDGSILETTKAGAAGVQGEALRLTIDAIGSTTTGWIIPGLGEPALQGWRVEFLAALSGGGARPADGFSFNWGDISGGVAGEEGFGQGLAVEFDTYDNSGEGLDTGIGIDVSVDGNDVEDGQNRIDPGDSNNDNRFFKFDGEFRKVLIDYVQLDEDNGVVTVIYGEETVFDQLAVAGMSPSGSWNFAFGARTGGATETLLIDNLKIVAPPPVAYAQSFDGFADGTTDLGDGSSIRSNDGVAKVVDGALQLTQDGTGSSQSAFRIPGLGGLAVEGWSARFELALIGGALPADGFAFNWGEIPEEGFEGEEGFGSGLAVEFDTYDNSGEGAASGIGIDVSIGAADVENGQSRIDPADPKNDNRFFKFDGEFRLTEIIWKKTGEGTGEVTVGMGGDLIYDRLPVTNFTPSDAYTFAFGARTTGGATETVLIDNLEITAPATESSRRDPRIDGDRTVQFAAGLGSKEVGQVLVTNEGVRRDLVIESGTLGGETPDAFAILTEFPLTVPPGESALVEVEFAAPTTLGTVRATMTLVNDDSLERARNRIVNLLGLPFQPSGAYVQDFDSFSDGTTDLGDGSIIFSSNNVAKIVDGALQLTQDETGSTSANFKLPPLGPGGNQAFIVTFDLKLESEGTPADGFSFNYGEIPDSATAGEEGFASGLAVEFDTYDNSGEGQASGIGLDISVNGRDVPDGTMRIDPGDDKLNNRFFKFDGEFRPVEITWFKSGEDSGLLTVVVDGETFYDNLPTPGFTAEPSYRFAFGARTGGAHETLQLDNMNFITGTEDPNLFVTQAVNSGVVQPNTPAQTLRIPVRNTGTDTDLEISSVEITPAGSAVYRVVSFPSSLPPGEGGVIEVSLDPAPARGLATAELIITSNDHSQPTTSVRLSVSVPLSADLVAWYKMDETGPGDLLDSSGNGRHGSFTGDVGFGEEALASGTALRLSSSGAGAAYASVGDFPALPSLTISMWVHVTGEGPASSQTLVSKSHPDSVAAYSLSLFPALDDTLAWVVSESPDVLEVAALNQPLTTPSHVVLVHEDANGDAEGAVFTRIYVNGVEVAAGDNSPGFADLDEVIQFGARVGENGFVGLMDDVQIYGRALTSQEVATLLENPGSAIGVEEVPRPPASLPTIGNVTLSAGGGLSFTLPQGVRAAIEYSSDLIHWNRIANGVTGTFEDPDPARMDLPAGYYRARP